MTQGSSDLRNDPAAENRVVIRQKHVWRWAVGAICIVAFAWFIHTLMNISVIDYDVIPRYLVDRTVLQGVLLTVELAVLSQAIGIVLGVVLSAARLSKNPVLKTLAYGYVWIFRGTPLILQILFWYNGVLLVFPQITMTIPFVDLTVFDVATSDILTVFVASLIALSLNQAAYMAEIVRGGISSIDRGQMEAAHALGLTSAETFRRILLPQATRVIIPPTGNQFLSMIKDTSLISVIAGGELLTSVRNIYSVNSLIFELLTVAACWYLVLTTVASIGQYFVERRLNRGHRSVTGS